MLIECGCLSIMEDFILLALDKRKEGYWDFKGISVSGIHKIAKYPATMIAPMQHEILKFLVDKNKNYKNMLDPFHGSGVTLVEGATLGLEVQGIDINPYAHLMSRVKLSALDIHKTIESIKNIESNIFDSQNTKIHDFYNISKWFRQDIIRDLSKIRNSIKREENTDIRDYFWLCFGEIVKKYSNTRTSTFKLHIKQKEKIAELENNIIYDFLEKIKNDYNLLDQGHTNKLYWGDSIKIMESLENDSFDIICTSPPYGDNATTVTYGQFSTLQLLWMDIEDIVGAVDIIENYSKIDSLSMGGNSRNSQSFNFTYESFNRFINQITFPKKKKSYRFISDYEKAFIEMVRILKPTGTIVLTLANRRIDNKEFPLVEVTVEMAQKLGLQKEYELNREIQNKRMPIKVSNIKNFGAVSSMSNETTLIFKKNNLY